MILNDMTTPKEEIKLFFEKQKPNKYLNEFFYADRFSVQNDISSIALKILKKAHKATNEKKFFLKDVNVKAKKFKVFFAHCYAKFEMSNHKYYDWLLVDLLEHLGLKVEGGSKVFSSKRVDPPGLALKDNEDSSGIYMRPWDQKIKGLMYKEYTMNLSWKSTGLCRTPVVIDKI